MTTPPRQRRRYAEWQVVAPGRSYQFTPYSRAKQYFYALPAWRAKWEEDEVRQLRRRWLRLYLKRPRRRLACWWHTMTRRRYSPVYLYEEVGHAR